MTRLEMIGEIRDMLPQLWAQDRFELAREIMGDVGLYNFSGVPDDVVRGIWNDLRTALAVAEKEAS